MVGESEVFFGNNGRRNVRTHLGSLYVFLCALCAFAVHKLKIAGEGDVDDEGQAVVFRVVAGIAQDQMVVFCVVKWLPAFQA